MIQGFGLIIKYQIANPMTQNEIYRNKEKDISASFFRMLWMLDMIRIENEFFKSQIGSAPIGKNIHRIMANTCATIESNIAAMVRQMPTSAHIVARERNNEKVAQMASILEVLMYCTPEQLDLIEDDFRSVLIDDNASK